MFDHYYFVSETQFSICIVHNNNFSLFVLTSCTILYLSVRFRTFTAYHIVPKKQLGLFDCLVNSSLESACESIYGEICFPIAVWLTYLH